jgi:hypothetical protein
MDFDSWQRAVTQFAIWEVALVVLVTWLVMLAMHPRGRIERATFGKETAFLIIMGMSVWRLLTMSLVPQPWALIGWMIVSILLTIYLAVFLWQWVGPAAGWLYECCKRWWPVILVIIITAALATWITLQ